MPGDGGDYVYHRAGGGSGFAGDWRSIKETVNLPFPLQDKAGGKVTDTEDVGLSPDLKTLTLTVHIPGAEKPNVMVFERTSPRAAPG